MLTEDEAEQVAEVLADLVWAHSKWLVRLGLKAVYLGQYHTILLASVAWDRMELQVREALGKRESWEL